MQPLEYEKLARMETTYWWYRGQRDIVADCLACLPRAGGAPILDAGCGTGRMGAHVAERLGAPVIGVDRSRCAMKYWTKGAGWRARASVDRLPFADESFAIVYTIDVLYHRGVDPQTACAEFARVLRPGGHVVLVEPAYAWLMSRHDRAVGSARRFTGAGLRTMLRREGLHMKRLTHLFPSFFPAIAVYRLLRSRARPRAVEPVESDLRPLPPTLNLGLYGVTAVERRLVRRLNFPFGTTLMAVGRKPAPPVRWVSQPAHAAARHGMYPTRGRPWQADTAAQSPG